MAPAAPQGGESMLPRPRLERLLDAATERRLTTIVASAGFGKSTLAAAWASQQANSAWFGLGNDELELPDFVRGLVDALRPRVPGLPTELAAAVAASGPDSVEEGTVRARAYAALVAQSLQEKLTRDLVLVIDDLHVIAPQSPSARLFADLIRQAPAQLHVVVSSRAELPFPVERLRGQGQLLELTAGELCFTVDEIGALLDGLGGGSEAAATGGLPADLAEQLYRATGGWPAAVRMIVESHRQAGTDDWQTTLARLRRHSGPFFRYLAEEVIPHESAAVRELIATTAPLRRFNVALCDALGVLEAAVLLPQLGRRGLFVEPDRTELDWYALSPLVREYALDALTPVGEERKRIRARAALWLAENGTPIEALRTVDVAADPALVAQLLVEHGDEMLSAGHTADLLRAARELPAELRDPAIDRLEGQARQVVGDWEGALECFSRAVADGPLQPALGWRMGLIHHLRGDLETALDTYCRADLSGAPDRDSAVLLGWRASVRWLLGDIDGCRADADLSLAQARALGDAPALATAHNAQAMLAALVGDRRANDTHYLQALDHAERAGDVLQLIRIRTNRGAHLIEEGAFHDALTELDLALRYADLAGFVSWRGLALSNRGEALLRLGRLEEAAADLNRSRAVYQSIGSHMVAYPLTKLAEVHMLRGDSALARRALDEALRLAEESHDRQALVPVLADMALVLLDEDPAAAAQHVERALALGAGAWQQQALLAAARVALALGDDGRAAARGHIAQAEQMARQRHDQAALAESLELAAAAGADPAEARQLLEQALGIWQEIDGAIEAARTRTALARLLDPAAGQKLAAEAAQALATAGARSLADEAEAVARQRTAESVPAVAVNALGGFSVEVHGRPVPPAAWQSRKARDLLKILVARRGHPVPREVLMEALWPEDEAAGLANRLSVLLSTLRGVLDPQREHDADQFVGADKDAIWLRLAHVDVDVEAFMRRAAEGMSRWRRGDVAPATELLAEAEAAYRGDLFEEDPYADWAVGLREEARAAYVGVARQLAKAAAKAGDHDAATRLYLRLLERDAYDEQAGLGLIEMLIETGRHGEARRWYRTYCTRMDEIGVEAAPYPSPTR